MKDKWRNYALKDGKIESCYKRERQNRDGTRKAAEASCGNSLKQSGQEQEEVKVSQSRKIDESSREKEPSETHQEGRQGIQSSDQGRCEAEEANPGKQRKEVMKKQTAKERKHEAKETKAYEKKEDKMESKVKKTEKVATAGRKRG